LIYREERHVYDKQISTDLGRLLRNFIDKTSQNSKPG
jgi:hypothetical protein